MVIFTAEEKLQAISRYLNGNESYKKIGESIGVDLKSILMLFRNLSNNLQHLHSNINRLK